MNIGKKSRRHFIKSAVGTSLLGAAGLAASSTLTACSSFDDFLFEDRFMFNDEVMIIGGGIAGLYLALCLRQNKTEFRLFEGGSRVGGRILSQGEMDFGASLFGPQDTRLNKLIDDLIVTKEKLDKEHFFIPTGMQTLSDKLLDRVIGLIPYRNLRLRWKLVEINKTSSGFELIFENPSGQKRYIAKHVALALPPSQWAQVRGLLDLPEMGWAKEWLNTLRVENAIKLILPMSALASPREHSLVQETTYEGMKLRQVIKNSKTMQDPHVEVDINYLSESQRSIDYIYSSLRKKLSLSFPFQSLDEQYYYDWSQIKLIQGGYFKNFIAVPEIQSTHFQVVGDFTAVKSLYTIEGALESAQTAAKIFL